MNMSDCVYTKPVPAAWQRWQPAPLPLRHADAACTPAPVQPDADAVPRYDTDTNTNADYAELARLREHAQQQGYAEGYREGHEQGLEEGSKAGHRAGYKEGLAQGCSAGEAQARDQVRRLEHVADRCAQAISTLEAQIGPQLVALALRVAEQVLQSTLTTQPEHLNDLVSHILRFNANSDDQTLLTLRIHPSDEAVLRPYLEQKPPGQRWRIMPDPTLEPGDCVAETATGSIDATLATRWERITSSLGHKLPWPPQVRNAAN